MPEPISLYMFPHTLPFRIYCHEICTRPLFINFVLVCICVSSLLLAAEDPLGEAKERNEMLNLFDHIFTGNTLFCYKKHFISNLEKIALKIRNICTKIWLFSFTLFYYFLTFFTFFYFLLLFFTFCFTFFYFFLYTHTHTHTHTHTDSQSKRKLHRKNGKNNDESKKLKI